MKEKVGEVFSIAKDNVPVPGCTISKEVQGGNRYPTDVTVGMRSAQGAVYAEVSLRREQVMNRLIKAGENFHFAKKGLHSVKAKQKFKMALLLTLE